MDMKQKILIVEDEPEIAELIRMHMDRNGFPDDRGALWESGHR